MQEKFNLKKYKMRNFKYLFTFLFLIGASQDFYSQSKMQVATKATSAVFNTSKKGLGFKSIKQLGTNTISQKTFTSSFTSFGGDLAKKSKLSRSLNESDILKWLKESGYKTKAAQTNIDKIGLDNLKKIYANLAADAPYNVKKVVIDDFRNNPKVMGEIFDSPQLLKSYTRVVAMAPSYRTSIDFLSKLLNIKGPMAIKTYNDQFEGQVLHGVKYLRRVVEIPNSGGLKVIGVFPDFKKFSIFELPIKNKLLKGDNEQFNYAFMNLQISLRRNKDLQKNFTPDQINELLSRKVISAKSKSTHIVPGYSWHHTEGGALQLVKTEVHDAVTHTGGRSLIGGGESLRYRNVDDLVSIGIN